MKNALGRELPDFIDGYGPVRPYTGISDQWGETRTVGRKCTPAFSGHSKQVPTIADAIDKIGLRDGMTVSFHHHLRNGDRVVNMVMEAIAEKGIKDLCVAASGLFPVHEPLVKWMEAGVVTKIVTSTFNTGPVAHAITAGKLRYPCRMMTHGGRARAILAGDLHIDAAFIAAPTCDTMGNLNGTEGPSACGVLSYAYADAECADHVVAVTDHLVPYPACPIEISQEKVDCIVCVDSIGDPNGIVSGTTRITEDPVRLKIASDTAKLMEQSGYLRDGMSFQTGASSTALAVAADVRRRMSELGIVGSFALGGIHAYMVKMLEEGLFRSLMDTQCFDLEAVRSASENRQHIPISASQYANPATAGPVVNMLDTVILGATEIDVDFNVNVTTGSNGVIMGAAGGHSDCAAGAKLAIVVANLVRKKFCIVRDAVTTVTTPGESIDALVTEYGIAINPRRVDLLKKLKDCDLPLTTIEELKRIGEAHAGPQSRAATSDQIVGIVEYRDGSVIDIVYKPIENI